SIPTPVVNISYNPILIEIWKGVGSQRRIPYDSQCLPKFLIATVVEFNKISRSDDSTINNRHFPNFFIVRLSSSWKDGRQNGRYFRVFHLTNPVWQFEGILLLCRAFR